MIPDLSVQVSNLVIDDLWASDRKGTIPVILMLLSRRRGRDSKSSITVWETLVRCSNMFEFLGFEAGLVMIRMPLYGTDQLVLPGSGL